MARKKEEKKGFYVDDGEIKTGDKTHNLGSICTILNVIASVYSDVSGVNMILNEARENPMFNDVIKVDYDKLFHMVWIPFDKIGSMLLRDIEEAQEEVTNGKRQTTKES